MLISKPVTIKFENETDIVEVRDMASEIASGMGFDKTSCAEAVLAVSEIVGNAVKFAGKGVVTIRLSGNKKSLEIIVQDNGPGIKSIKKAMEEGYSSKSKPGQGTTVF